MEFSMIMKYFDQDYKDQPPLMLTSDQHTFYRVNFELLNLLQEVDCPT